MDKRQRIAMQRVLVREAFGKLYAAKELFSVEDGAVAGDSGDEYDVFRERVEEFEDWMFSASPIA